jgi:iron(III) transport system ATP-binding protein
MSAPIDQASVETAQPARLWSRPWGQRGTAGAAIPASLTFDNLHLAYDETFAVKDVNLTITAGEIICFLGQSGGGKTSLLRLVAGLERPTKGRILLDEREVSSPTTLLAPEKRHLSLMFQDYALFPHMDVLSNVLFGLRYLSKQEARAQALNMLARVGMEAFANTYPHALSGGEQQRVALARAIAPRPGVLLMDEPFSNLDQSLRDTVREETLALIRESGATTLLVTHDAEEAMRLADRIVLMRHGHIVQVGTPEDIYRRPMDVYAARFFSDLNEVNGIVHKGRVDLPFAVIPAPHLEEGTSVSVCIRPQGIKLAPAGFCVPARVIERRCLGPVELVGLAVQGMDTPLRVRLRTALGETVVMGQDVGIDIIPQEVLVFPLREG